MLIWLILLLYQKPENKYLLILGKDIVCFYSQETWYVPSNDPHIEIIHIGMERVFRNQNNYSCIFQMILSGIYKILYIELLGKSSFSIFETYEKLLCNNVKKGFLPVHMSGLYVQIFHIRHSNHKVSSWRHPG